MTFERASTIRSAVSRILDRLLWFLHRRPVLVLGILFIPGVLIIFWHLSRLSSELNESAVLQTAAVYSESLAEFRTLYTSEVVARVKSKGVEVTHDYATKEGAIPLPATLSMALGYGTHGLPDA